MSSGPPTAKQFPCDTYYRKAEVAFPGDAKTEKDDHATYELLLSHLRTIPSDDFLILKVGSNDSAAAVADGSKGKAGKMFVEFPAVTGRTGRSNEVPWEGCSKYVRVFGRSFDQVGRDSNRIHLISVSPEKIYHAFSYPFKDSTVKGTENLSEWVQDFLEHPKENQRYVQGNFPIGVNPDASSFNAQILNFLVNFKGPLFLFNAMGSTCYQSLKYILDMRKSQYTFYGGLVDTSAICDFGIEIYPDPETSCTPYKREGGVRTKRKKSRKNKKTRKVRKQLY